jgi:hypothetical protein
MTEKTEKTDTASAGAAGTGAHLTGAEMRALVAEHAAMEHANDWDGALATMVADGAYYEVFPYRLRIDGAEAITRWWLSFKDDSSGEPIFDAAIDPASHHVREYVDGDSLVQVLEWDFVTDDGERLPTYHVAAFRFRDGRILSESIFCDVNLMRFMDKALSDEFRAHPGVSPI